MVVHKCLSLREAADILGVGESASIIQIRTRYHALVRKWHPDISEHTPEETHNEMVRLNEAYDVLIEYCMRYEIFFYPDNPSPAMGKDPDDDWMDRFGDDPIWGNQRSSSNR
ncbi:J domain-containing protein [Methanocalculus sp.]|uniref:J domain-containing protein n=1 Tax=Methanocalculus sp. TaxID=2004547 RepID=UPI00271E0BCE|nr:J domain-containing protein [Methanocalculus sp.]MDO8840874.1 J domain-containing protein [Methanocalculus sp.]